MVKIGPIRIGRKKKEKSSPSRNFTPAPPSGALSTPKPVGPRLPSGGFVSGGSSGGRVGGGGRTPTPKPNVGTIKKVEQPKTQLKTTRLNTGSLDSLLKRRRLQSQKKSIQNLKSQIKKISSRDKTKVNNLIRRSRNVIRTTQGGPIENLKNLEEALKTADEKITESLSKERTKRQRRNIQTGGKALPLVLSNLKTTGLSVSRPVVRAGRAGTSLILGSPQLIKNIPQAPKAISRFVKDKSFRTEKISDLKRTTRQFKRNQINLLKTSPTDFIASVGTELFLLKGTSKGLRVVGKASELGSARISRGFKGNVKTGDIITLGKGKDKVDIRIAGGIGGKNLPRETLRQQAFLSGKQVNAVSTQADRIINVLKKSRKVKKPLGGLPLSESAKKLLKKFDDGKINSRELTKLDDAIKKARSKGLLERAFFADPRGRVRPSRGIAQPREANLRDLFTGNFKLRKNKPQILVFKGAKVQKFPKSLKKIENRLKANKPLTHSQSNELLQFQLRKTGKFKPVGFLTREPEITLAPGEIIKRSKKLGTVIINERKVPIIQATVGKIQNKEARKLINKISGNKKLTKKETNRLNKILDKESGFKTKISSSRKGAKPILNLKGKGLSIGVSLGKPKVKSFRPNVSITRSRGSRKKPSRKPVSKPREPFITVSKGPSIKKGSGKVSTTSPKKSAKSVARSGSSIGRTISTGSTARRATLKLKVKGKKSKKQEKPIQVFNVYAKSGKKFFKINKKPLNRNDALSRGAFAVDNTVSRTFEIRPAGKSTKVTSIPKKQRNYFNRQGFKLREFKIRKGRRFAIKPRFIEKRRFGIDTKGEKTGLTIAKFLKQSKKTTRRKSKPVKRTTTKRRATPAQLKALEKARKALRQKRRKSG